MTRGSKDIATTVTANGHDSYPKATRDATLTVIPITLSGDLELISKYENSQLISSIKDKIKKFPFIRSVKSTVHYSYRNTVRICMYKLLIIKDTLS